MSQVPANAAASATNPSPPPAVATEAPKKKRRSLLKFTRATSGLAKMGGYLFLLIWWTFCLFFNLPLLFTYWGEWRYEKDRKFNIYPMPKLTLIYAVLTSGVFLALLVHWGIPSSMAAYIWILFLMFTIYTISDDVTWSLAWIVFLVALCAILALALVGLRFQIPIFLPAWNWLESFEITYPTRFVGAFCALGGIVLFIRMVVEMSRVHIHVQGNTFRVMQLGIGSEAHSISNYEVRVEIPDFNERMVYGMALLILAPNDANKPSYKFYVYGAHIIANQLQEMKDKPDFEMVAAKE